MHSVKVKNLAESINNMADKIRNLEIRGARNVAISAVKAIENAATHTKAKTAEAFAEELLQAKEVLYAARPTEPLMRNAIKWVIGSVESSQKDEVKALVRLISSSACEFLTNLERSRDRIAEVGSKRINNGTVVFTHCHSSTVTHLLTKASKGMKTFRVICTETRPLFQGRVTAREMLELGVETALIIDSAARCFIKQADLLIVGADALTSEGNVVNKIGTAAIALLAQEARVPFYVVSELLKFDPATLCGHYESIEERGRFEIWRGAPENLVIHNPAFEVVRRDFIHGIICEEGIIPPHSVYETVVRKYPWVLM
jgi:ribose 1,5-bisphosphate isomerase